MWKKFVTKLLAVALPFVLFAPLQAVAGESLLDEIIDRGTIKIGSTLQYPPQMYRDENGDPAGYDVELMKMLANDMHVELEVVDMDFPGLIPALLAGKVDMLSVGLVNTPERALALEFTDGYVPYSQVVVVQKNSAAESVSDLNREGMKITALLGSTAENLAKAKFPNAEIDMHCSDYARLICAMSDIPVHKSANQNLKQFALLVGRFPAPTLKLRLQCDRSRKE